MLRRSSTSSVRESLNCQLGASGFLRPTRNGKGAAHRADERRIANDLLDPLEGVVAGLRGIFDRILLRHQLPLCRRQVRVITGQRGVELFRKLGRVGGVIAQKGGIGRSVS